MRLFLVILGFAVNLSLIPFGRAENSHLDREEAERAFKEHGANLRTSIDRVLAGNDADLLDFVRLVCKVEADFYGGWSHAAQGVYDSFASVADKIGDARLAVSANALNAEEKDLLWSVLLGGAGSSEKLREKFPHALATLQNAFSPIGVMNPKRLVSPVWLTRALYCMCDGEVGGTLMDSQGQSLHFHKSQQQLYIGFISGHLNDRMKAKFDGWTEDDLWLVVDEAIRNQFVQDQVSRRFRAKNPKDGHSGFLEEPFGQQGLRQVSRQAKGWLEFNHPTAAQ